MSETLALSNSPKGIKVGNLTLKMVPGPTVTGGPAASGEIALRGSPSALLAKIGGSMYQLPAYQLPGTFPTSGGHITFEDGVGLKINKGVGTLPNGWQGVGGAGKLISVSPVAPSYAVGQGIELALTAGDWGVINIHPVAPDGTVTTLTGLAANLSVSPGVRFIPDPDDRFVLGAAPPRGEQGVVITLHEYPDGPVVDQVACMFTIT